MKLTFFRILKTIFIPTLALAILTNIFSLPTQAQTPTAPLNSLIHIEILSRPDCPHCQAEKQFLDQLALIRTDFQATFYNIREPINYQLFLEFTQLAKLPKVTPITLIGADIIPGFGTDQTTGKQIKLLIDK